MSNNEKDELTSKYEKYSNWAEWAARLILLGLAVEIIEVFVLKKSFIEGTFTIGATVLILLGVWGEVIFEKWAREASDGIVAEANARASEANARAKEAELAVQRLGDRYINPEEFAEALEGKGKAPVEIFFIRYDNEAYSFALQIKGALLRAGWEVIDLSSKTVEEIILCIPLARAPPVRGVVVTLQNPTESEKISFRGARASMGTPGRTDVPSIKLFRAVSSTRAGIWKASIQEVDPRQLDAPPPGALRIIIGPKA